MSISLINFTVLFGQSASVSRDGIIRTENHMSTVRFCLVIKNSLKFLRNRKRLNKEPTQDLRNTYGPSSICCLLKRHHNLSHHATPFGKHLITKTTPVQ